MLPIINGLPDYDFRYFITNYYLLTVIVVCFSILLFTNSMGCFMNRHRLLLFMYADYALAIANVAEGYCSRFPAFRTWRVILSVVGYSLSVYLAMLTITVIYNKFERPKWLGIPAIINIIIHCLAFFTKWVFYFDENYDFNRGPLGYTSFIISGFYLILLLFLAAKKSGRRDKKEFMIIVMMIAVIVITCIIEVFALSKLQQAETIYVVCLTIYFSYLYIQSAKKDPLTMLPNRTAYVERIASKDASITGLIGIDMNGLKTVNDNGGHYEGDLALQQLSNVLIQSLDESMQAFRVGGDEFVILCFGTPELTILRFIDETNKRNLNTNHTCSIGYSIRKNEQSILDMEKEADVMMYSKKQLYYSLKQLQNQ